MSIFRLLLLHFIIAYTIIIRGIALLIKTQKCSIAFIFVTSFHCTFFWMADFVSELTLKEICHQWITQCPRTDLNKRSLPRKRLPQHESLYPIGLGKDLLFKTVVGHCEHKSVLTITKGQVISKANFKVFIWTKNPMKIFLYFCPSLWNGWNLKDYGSLSC